MGRFLLLILACSMCLGACARGELRPMTPLDVRLGRAGVAARQPLEPPTTGPARSFLLPRPLVQRSQDGSYQLQVVLDGDLTERLRVEWAAEGGTVVPDGVHAKLVAPGAWRVEARLVEAGREHDRVLLEGPDSILSVAGTADGLIVRGAPSGTTLQFEPPQPTASDGRTRLVGLRPGTTISARALRDGEPVTPWATATVGALPSVGHPLELDPLACDDASFPRQVAGGHATCSQGDVLDRWRGPDGVTRELLLGREGSRDRPVHARAGWADDVRGATGGLVHAGDRLGGWTPGDRFVRFLGDRSVRGRPASDGHRLAFARADRVEIGGWNTGSRVQIPARPLEVERPVAVSGDWLAIVEGTVGAEVLRLHDIERRRSARLAHERSRDPALVGSWMCWLDDAAFVLMPLEGGASRRVPVEAAAGPTAALDDWFLVPRRGGGMLAVHAPTGIAEELGHSGITELRGAGAGRLTTWHRAPGEAGVLLLWAPALRVFEESGPNTTGQPVVAIPGGHGGSSGRLPAGGTRELVFDPGPEPARLEAWIPGQGVAPAHIEVRQGPRNVATVSLDGSDEGPGRWVLLGRIAAPPGASPAERLVRLTWTAGAEGGLVDAVRLVPEAGL